MEMKFVSYKLCKLFVYLMCFQMFLCVQTISHNLHFPAIYTIFTRSLQKCKRVVLL
jgi:hypothetical protein